ncbi:hypothetical protein CDD81_1955 [Ophiocordyceps australis]|uniref:Inositol polyphosphate-related phosphatase domain-containing protein n=1 Tax=Ophiocordyceps australis TaxID=1399860 RepID=A0A2C5XXU1_9HYPO|nr:hypothetical protein CDD81_1955 [Ophiocordyceps australis]
MSSSSLDLVVITFNCAKHLIDVGVFATHVQSVFEHKATSGLADVVVISLQEVGPLSQAFIGDYFLRAYLARFDEAINLAAVQHCSEQDAKGSGASKGAGAGTGGGEHGGQETTSDTQAKAGRERKPYSLVKAHNVGFTAILLFARDPKRLRNMEQAEVGFGTADMGSKGAVGLRMLYVVEATDTTRQQSTELTFVATHLAAMEWNLGLRNANWEAIMRGMTFKDPMVFAQPGLSSSSSSSSSSSPCLPRSASAEEQHRLLQDERDERVQQQLRDVSIFKPSSYLFVAGDLNYRISTTSPGPKAVFPSLDPESENYWPAFLPLDQLTREREAGRTLHGLTEHEVRFPPTYKYVVKQQQSATHRLLQWRQGAGSEHVEESVDEQQLPCSFAPHRYPSWTDRILYLDLPSWVKARPDAPRITVHAYDALAVMRSSDHRPVYMRVNVPLVSPKDMVPPPTGRVAETDSLDPRVQSPVDIDAEAWQRRRAARNKELVLGWTMFLWSTPEGTWTLAALLVAGLGAYWLYRTV